MRTIPPQIKTIQQPIQFLHAQNNRFVSRIGRCFETFGLQTLEPKAKAVALPIKDFHSITGAIQKNEKHGVEHGDLDIQLHQGCEAVDGFSEVDGFGVTIDFQLWRRDASWLRAPDGDREHSIRLQVAALNVYTVDRLRSIGVLFITKRPRPARPRAVKMSKTRYPVDRNAAPLK